MWKKSDLQARLTKFQGYNKKYQGYPGSPGDDCMFGIYGYTVRDERGYIRRQISWMKKALAYMEEHGTDIITDTEAYYL